MLFRSIEDCWHASPSHRPSIDQVLDRLESSLSPTAQEEEGSGSLVSWHALADMEHMLSDMQAALHQLMLLQHMLDPTLATKETPPSDEPTANTKTQM